MSNGNFTKLSLDSHARLAVVDFRSKVRRSLD
jgi:hypothetical protein